MLRFNVTVWETVQALSEFQYILCYGSTSMTVLIDFEDKDFNTSYVTVQLKSLLNASTLYIISIHPMLRFNNKCKSEFGIRHKFQYILCYGSTHNQLKQLFLHIGFQYILCYGSTS